MIYLTHLIAALVAAVEETDGPIVVYEIKIEPHPNGHEWIARDGAGELTRGPRLAVALRVARAALRVAGEPCEDCEASAARLGSAVCHGCAS